MPESRYFVVRDHDQWLIKYHDESYGPYKSQSEATMFAIDAARKLGRWGDSAEVCLIGENGQFRTEWRSGYNVTRSRH
jgi:hypothetical protein